MIVEVIFAILNKIISILGVAVSAIVNIFPASPFQYVSNSQYSDLLSKINYFVPFYDFLVVLEGYLVAVAIYYLYSVWARWLKAIE